MITRWCQAKTTLRRRPMHPLLPPRLHPKGLQQHRREVQHPQHPQHLPRCPPRCPPQEQRQMMWNKKKQSPSRPQRVAPPALQHPQPWCTHHRPCQPHRHHQQEVQASMQHLPIRCLQHLPSSRHLQDIPQPQHRCRRCRRCQHVLLRSGHQVLRLCGRCRGTCSP